MDFVCGGNRILGDVASFLRPFHALRQSVLMTVRRGAFFDLWKGVKQHESELRLPWL